MIRIGGNDFAKPNGMDRLARDPNDGEVQGKVTACLAAIHDAVALLHARQPQLRVVLVGVFNPVHWAAYLDRWRSPQAVEHIDQGLDRFDNALRAFARADPRLAFFDDRDWFRQVWGGRDAQGQPAYKAVRLNAGMEIRNTVGDAPSNAALEDGHCGAVWNGLWAQALIKLLNDRFGLAIPPIEEPELVQLLMPELVP